VLFTDAAVERLGIDPIAAGLERHRGKYAHFDEMDCYVAALDRFDGAGQGISRAMLLGLRALLSDLALGADPGAQHDLGAVVAA
jgi:hypothetical protein